MTYETFYKAKDLVHDIANLNAAKDFAITGQNLFLPEETYRLIFERIYLHDKNMYKAIMENIAERLEARVFELNIELEAI